MGNLSTNTDGHIWNSETEVGIMLGAIIAGGNYGNILELGFFKGYTSFYITQWLSEATTGIKIFDMVDITDEHIDKQQIKDILAFKDVSTKIHIGDSIEFLKKCNAAAYDMIFIDTTHTLEQTRAEFKEAERIIKTNGIIALHDSISHPGVKEWVDYIKQFSWFEIITLPTSRNNGLTLVKCLMEK